MTLSSLCQHAAICLGLFALAPTAVGCGYSPEASDDAAGSVGDPDGPQAGEPGEPDVDPGLGPAVGQGGAQDFGQFRAILEAGDIPAPETLDDVGFFAEHRIGLGTAECEDSVCLHGELGVMGNMVSGSNCTMVMLGMTTPIDPEEIERPPLNLSIAVDTSASMSGEAIEYVRLGLHALSDSLGPEDRVTLIGFSDRASVLAQSEPGGSAGLAEGIEMVAAHGQTNLYAGLREALESVHASATPEHQNRVIVLSDGEATTGLVGDARLLELGRAYADEGIAISTVGVGDQFNPELMRGLSELGGGAFYFLEDLSAVQEVFVEEAAALLLPLAQDVRIDVETSGDYEVRATFGTKLQTATPGGVRLEMPALVLAHRTSTDDNEGGRRGGGGAIVVELLPAPGASATAGEVGTLTMSYRVPYSDEVVEQVVEIESPLPAGETPAAGHFTSDGVRKAFVTLNLYAGLRSAAEAASIGDDRGALSTLLALADAVVAWEQENPDADIADDLRYVDMFIQNLRDRGAEEPAPEQEPADPWPQD